MTHSGSILASGSGLKGRPWASSGVLLGVEGLLHGFTLRSAGDFAQDGPAKELVRATGATALRLLRQVHGTAVVRPEDSRGLPEADGWVGTPEPGILLGIRTADCLPVLYCHPATRCLGLAHAGWRGATAGIATDVLKWMSVPAEEILVALGPAIGPCCYEVGEDVAAAVGVDSPHLRATKSGKYYFDLPGFVQSQLFDAGVRPRNLDRIDFCTASRTDLLYSYRAELHTGRQCAFLGWEQT